MSDKILDALNDGQTRTFDDWLQLVKTDRASWSWHRRLRNNFRWKVAQPIRGIPRAIRRFVQRGCRGWADEDLWNMDTFLARVNVEMLGRLIEVAHGYPPDFEDEADGFDQLIFLLEGMKAGWEAYLKAFEPDTGWEESRALIAQHEAMMASYAQWYSGLFD